MKPNSSVRILTVAAAAALLALASDSARALTVPVAQDTSSTKGELTLKAGKTATLTVSDDQVALLEFDIQNLDVVPETITPGEIKSAILELYVVKTNMAATLKVLAVTGAWNETFAAKTEPLPSIASTVSGTIPVPDVPYKQFVSVDITAAVVGALESGSNLSLAVETSTPGAKITLGSKDGPSAGYSAVLDIEAGLGGATGPMGPTGLTGATGATGPTGSIGNEISLPATTTAGNAGVLSIGGNPFLSSPGVANTFVGGAGNFTMSGDFNTVSGNSAFGNNTSGGSNTGSGYGALNLNTTGAENTANGYAALDYNRTGVNNIAEGYFAGANLTTGSNNIEIGDYNPVTGMSDDVAGEGNTIRIGAASIQTATYIAGIYGASSTDPAAMVVYADHTGRLVTSSTAPMNLPAGSVTGAAIANGAIGSAQLAANLTLGGTTTGIFSGDGSALTNLPGVAASGTVPAIKTRLLFSYVTNGPGFETGISVANTGMDDTGTVGTSGTLTLYFFGGSGAPITVDGGTLAPGQSYVSNLTAMVGANFTGYIVAVCNFPYAHGFAYVVNGFGTSTATSTMSPALVLPVTRSTSTPEGLGQ